MLKFEKMPKEEMTMVFSNAVFLFVFMPIVLVGYYLIKGKALNYWLLAVSLFFYGWNKNPGASAAAGAPGFMQG